MPDQFPVFSAILTIWMSLVIATIIAGVVIDKYACIIGKNGDEMLTNACEIAGTIGATVLLTPIILIAVVAEWVDVIRWETRESMSDTPTVDTGRAWLQERVERAAAQTIRESAKRLKQELDRQGYSQRIEGK